MRSTPIIQLGLILCTASLALSGCNSSSNSPTGTPSSSTVAYVYVSNQTTSSGPNQIVAYAADTKGQLTPVTGSPFSQNVISLAASGGYLVAASATQADINTYKIGSTGALTLGPQFALTQQTGGITCGTLAGFIFDRTGQSLYAEVPGCGSNIGIDSFTFNPSNGNLSYLGNVNIGVESSAAVSILGNNTYAYTALNDNCMYGSVAQFPLSNTGNLSLETTFVVTPQFGPPAPAGATFAGVKSPSYAAWLTATDTTNHVAMAEYPCYAQNGVVATLVQLATYTADASGNLTTVDTSATMPTTTIKPQDMQMSPSGSLLAVGGVGGVQVFHFNGASAITSFGSALTTDNISQIFWDKSNHLYAITQSASLSSPVTPGKLHVFTVTDTSTSEAPGSPYTITAPIALAVQSE